MIDDELIQVVLPPWFWPGFEQWLERTGLYLFRMPVDNPDDLDTCGIGRR